MAKVLIYIHGLGSVGQSAKTKELAEALKPQGVTVLAPDLPLDPAEVVLALKTLVQGLYEAGDLEHLVFCGTSLGGFYSSYFGEVFDAPYIAVNPAVMPSKMLEKYLSAPPISYATGAPLVLTQEMLAAFARLEHNTTPPSKHLAHVFIAKNDAIIPFEYAADKYAGCSTVLTESGGHRFESEWSRVIAKAKELLNDN